MIRERVLLGWLNKSTQSSGLLAVAIEPEAIKFAQGRAAKRDRPLATRWWSIPCSPSEQADSLQRETKEQGLARFMCTTLLEPADYQILLVEPPKVPADELKAAIRWRIKDLLEYHIDDATVDVFEVRAEGDTKGSARAMYAVATPNEVVQKRIALFQDARVPLKVIDIPEMAQRNVAALFESPDKATAMLAFSPWGGMLTISFRGELLLTRRLEVTSVQLGQDRKSTRLNSSHSQISYAVFCLKKKTTSAEPCPECRSLLRASIPPRPSRGLAYCPRRRLVLRSLARCPSSSAALPTAAAILLST